MDWEANPMTVHETVVDPQMVGVVGEEFGIHQDLVPSLKFAGNAYKQRWETQLYLAKANLQDPYAAALLVGDVQTEQV